jgi:hypothetical protein
LEQRDLGGDLVGPVTHSALIRAGKVGLEQRLGFGYRIVEPGRVVAVCVSALVVDIDGLA